MSKNIQIAIAGANGKMGTLLSELIDSKDGFEVSEIIDRKAWASYKVRNTFKDIKANYLFIFVPASAVRGFIKKLWIDHRDNPDAEIRGLKGIVIGSSGLIRDDHERIREYAEKNNIIACVIPNFSIGAIYQKMIAKKLYDNFDSLSIIEKHNIKKNDYPSGTTIDLVNSLEDEEFYKPIGSKKIKGTIEEETIEEETNVPNKKIKSVKSIRSQEYMAEQIVNFENEHENLIIEHIVNDRKAYLAGINLVLDSLGKMSGFYLGLESILKNRFKI